MFKTNACALILAISGLTTSAAAYEIIPSPLSDDGRLLTPLQSEIEKAGSITPPENLVAQPLPSIIRMPAPYTFPSEKVSAARFKFRSKYDVKYWDDYEAAKTEDEKAALIAKLDDNTRRYEIMSKSWIGTGIGYMFDPITLIALGVLFFAGRVFYKRHLKAITLPLG